MRNNNNKGNTRFRLVISCLLIFSLQGCGNGDEPGDSLLAEGEGISVEGAWTRPGGEGRMSAGYFLITNFEETADTLTGVSSEISRLTEIHESYELEEGMMGMREVSSVPLQPRSTVRFEPGGLHIMFIQLRQEIRDGDQVEIELQFAGREPLTVTLPVRR